MGLYLDFDLSVKDLMLISGYILSNISVLVHLIRGVPNFDAKETVF